YWALVAVFMTARGVESRRPFGRRLGEDAVARAPAGLTPSPARSRGVDTRPGCSRHSRTKPGSRLRAAAALQACATAHILTLAAGQKHVNTPLSLLANLVRSQRVTARGVRLSGDRNWGAVKHQR